MQKHVFRTSVFLIITLKGITQIAICNIWLKIVNNSINITKHTSIINSFFQVIFQPSPSLFQVREFSRILYANYDIWLTLTSTLI